MDTAARSLAHWSEDGRAEMDAFYALARRDYERLARGFVNLGVLSKAKGLDAETVLFLSAMKSALVGFVLGACFAPVAYQFFPYFFVCYTSVLVATLAEREGRSKATSARPLTFHRFARA